MPPLPIRPAPDPTPTLSTLSRTLTDVRTYQLPRLRGCTTASLARDLASEARSDLESVRAGLESSREACEAVSEKIRPDVLRMWEGVEEEYLEARDEFRAALVLSKRATVAAAKRHELLDAAPEDVPRAEATVGVGGDDALQTKTNEVTDALRRTTQLLQSELERSVLSTQMLDESTRTLKTTQGLYDNYGALLTVSSQLVRALERADWWDRILIMGALSFFLLCVAYVVKRRVLDRVGGFAVWWVGGSWRLLKLIGGGESSSPAVREAVDRVAVGVAGGTAISVVAGGATAAASAASIVTAVASAASVAKGGSLGGTLLVGTPGSPAAVATPGVSSAVGDVVRDVASASEPVAVPVNVDDLAGVGIDSGDGVGHVLVPELGTSKHAVEQGDHSAVVTASTGAEGGGEKVAKAKEDQGGRVRKENDSPLSSDTNEKEREAGGGRKDEL